MNASKKVKLTKEKKLVMLPLFLIVLLDMLGLGIIIPILAPIFLNTGHSILPPYFQDSMRNLLLGILISTYPVFQFFGAPLLGALSDRYGRKKILLISLIGTFVGYIIFGIGISANNVYLLFISRALDGFTGGNISIALSSIADLSDEKAKARNFGLIGMAFGIGFILGPYIGGKLADSSIVSWFNFATPLWFAAILTLFNIILLLINYNETLKTRIHTKINLFTGFRNIGKALRLPNLRVMFIVIFLLGLGFNFFTQFFQVYLIKKFSYNQSQIGDIFAYIGLWIALTQGILTRLMSKWFKPKQILPFSVLTLSIAFIALLLPNNPSYIFFIVPFVAMSQGLTFPNATAIVSNLSGKESQGEILGINQSMQSLAQSISPVIAGMIVTFNRALPIIAASLITIIAWLAFIIFFREKKEELFHEV